MGARPPADQRTSTRSGSGADAETTSSMDTSEYRNAGMESRMRFVKWQYKLLHGNDLVDMEIFSWILLRIPV